MKKQFFNKTMITLIGVGVCQTAWADEITGSYIQADVGAGYMKADTLKHHTTQGSLKSSYKKTKLTPRVSVGYDFGDWRVAGDYTHYGSIEKGNQLAKTKTSVRGAGLSAMYDFNLALPVAVTPYVGARVSVNKVKQETTLSSNNSVTRHRESNTKISPSLLAGANYKLNRHLTVDAGYRYNHLDSKVQVHEASVGLRYSF